MVLAMGSYKEAFLKNYNVASSSKIGSAGCTVCHAKPSGGKLNVYGLDLQKAMKGGHKMTPDILKSAEGLDSNKNGKTNIQDIKADTLPGA